MKLRLGYEIGFSMSRGRKDCGGRGGRGYYRDDTVMIIIFVNWGKGVVIRAKI